MGYNSTIVVMNDALDQIAKDKEFGNKLQTAIATRDRGKSHADISSGNYVNAATVIDCQHADVTQVLAVGWNHGRVIDRIIINYHDEQVTPEEKILRQLAEKLGYRVSKKPQK